MRALLGYGASHRERNGALVRAHAGMLSENSLTPPTLSEMPVCDTYTVDKSTSATQNVARSGVLST